MTTQKKLLFGTLAVVLALFLFVSGHAFWVSAAPSDDLSFWRLPSCPRELTLQDGSRWGKPQWAERGCEAVIGWRVEPVNATPVTE